MSQAVSVLLVEDNEVDREAVRRGFARHKIGNPLYYAADGLEALAILRGVDGFERIPRPYLLLLDINMPRMDGVEFLHELRADPQLHDSVVFVLTTSKRDEDRFAAYQQNVAGYIVKADVGEGFVKLTTLLTNYWTLVVLPEERP